ncbi:MAG: aldo/keto reductase, partial [Sutterellaceae bacterium]|nr:aldo/keto reductase [Sutterellaceae bacterium]
MGLLTYSPLDGGLLAGALKKAADKSRRAKPSLPIKDPKFYERVAAYEAFCEREGLDPADVALAWVLANPVVTSPIVGPRTVEQLEKSVKALDIKLTARQLAELDTIFPGPGGEAPEAYAW